MPKVIYIEADGNEHVVDATSGTSAMKAALDNNILGIDGDCGGQAACATCHVYVDPAWLEKTGVASSDLEAPMIELTEGGEANSRLACQIELSEDLDGLILRLPERQF